MMKITNLRYLSKGKRSKVYTALYKKRKIAVKYSSRAEIEAHWLKKLSKLGFIPELKYSDNEKIIYEFIEGETIGEYLEKTKNPVLILKQILKQCYELDELRINKKELTNPYKHILIKDNKAKMIDFERCYETNNPKNVTQFGQYIMSGRISSILKKKKIIVDKKAFTKALKDYKGNKSKLSFLKVLSSF